MREARRNEEVISLAESQVLRWITELNGITDLDTKVEAVKAEIRRLKKGPPGVKVKHEIRALYDQLDELQFVPDYMCLIIDKEKDYWRACKGFTINGIKYVRLLGTNGGIKNSTIVFVSDRVADELKKRIENGREPGMPLVTAKLEAYKALTCSASNPVSMPEGILVVKDAETTFFDDIVYLTDENSDEPIIETRTHEKITNTATDGCGIMLPSLAERWSEELDLGYTMSGGNIRMSWAKGMVFAFDFIDFAENVAGSYKVRDAWGNEVDVRDVELILTTSMVKLWDSYRSCDEYLRKSRANHYTFAIAKVCPEELETQRTLNYQYENPYTLTDDDIEELIAPTMNDIKDILGNDWRKTALFLRGVGIDSNNADSGPDDYIKAILIEHSILNDAYVQNNIYRLIKKRIDEAKIGVLNVHGNYSVVSGDPYLLCQSMFGLELTGLLKSGEIYNKYWADTEAERLACYRSPMTCYSNIRSVVPVRSDEARYWYRYMTTCTIMNAWDTATAALNGMDFDGDLVMLTDNPVLVRSLRQAPALVCAQRKAAKVIPTEEDLIRSNIASFGNDIGRITNWVTSMFDVQSAFDPSSREYKELAYRIQCGQLYQQNAIDKAKGIIAKPMPLSWHERRAAAGIEDEAKRELYCNIVAAKKPYFMRYIYPALKKDYRTYTTNANKNALREFRITVDELAAIPDSERTERQREFMYYYDLKMPVSIGNCVVNRICRRFEEEFDGHVKKQTASKAIFDYGVLKSDAEYTQRQFASIKALYEDYNQQLASYMILSDIERLDSDATSSALTGMEEEFRRQCDLICPSSEVLCNIILDLCYKKNSTKRFAWKMCGGQIIANLLKRRDGVISYPTYAPDGDIDFKGLRFREESKEVNTDDDCSE